VAARVSLSAAGLRSPRPIRHQSPRSTSHYEDCTTGRIRLVPDQIGVDALRADYAEMANAGMFRAEPPDFDWVMDRVGVLEATINNGAPGNDSAPTGPTPGSNGSE